jgi:choline monooxygenase
MVFGCLDEAAPPFEVWAGELPAAFQALGDPPYRAAFQFAYDVPVNWKLYVENGLEGYHIQFVHDFLADLVPNTGDAENFLEAHSSYTLAPVSAQLAQMVAAAGGPANPRIRFGHVFPNLIPVLTPGDFSYLRIDPVAPDRMRLTARSFDLDAEPARALRAFRAESFDRTNQQDIAVVRRVQQGLQAGSRLPPGTHAVMLEARIGHFERLLLGELRRGPAGHSLLRRAG